MQSPIEMLADVRQEIAAVQQKLQELKAIESWLAGRAGDNKADPKRAFQPPISQPASGAMDLTATKRTLAEQLLRKHAEPMRTAEMVVALKALGYQTDLEDRNLANTLFTAMSRDGNVFCKYESGLWGLVEWKK